MIFVDLIPNHKLLALIVLGTHLQQMKALKSVTVCDYMDYTAKKKRRRERKRSHIASYIIETSQISQVLLSYHSVYRVFQSSTISALTTRNCNQINGLEPPNVQGNTLLREAS